MIYLASPYSHEDKLIMKTRYLLALECCAVLFSKDISVFSPIVHCHEIAERYNLRTDAIFWAKYNMDMLRRSDGLYVLSIEGWERSRGVAYEMRMAGEMRLPIAFINQAAQTV